jgi:hypothetical protein
MRDKNKARRRLVETRVFMAFVGLFWIASTVLMVGSLSKLSVGGNGITALVVGEGTKFVPQTAGSTTGFSSLVYFAGFVLFGGVLFVVSRYSTELKTILKIEEDKEYFTTNPKTAMDDFFRILINWSTKYATNIKSVLDVMQQIKSENSKKLPVLKGIEFRLSDDTTDIEVKIDGEMEWEDLYVVFKAFLHTLDINEERFIHIAEYMRKNDVALILRKLGKVGDLIVKEVEKGSKKK